MQKCIYCENYNVVIWQSKKESFKCKDCNKYFTKNSNPFRNKKDENGKFCTCCKTFKNYSEFWKNGDKLFRSKCKVCYTKSSTNTTYKYKSKNITKEIFEKQLILQDYKCKICKNDFKSSRKTYIDHNHTTGEFRGILCPSCNTAIGLLKEDITIIETSIKYIINNGKL